MAGGRPSPTIPPLQLPSSPASSTAVEGRGEQHHRTSRGRRGRTGCEGKPHTENGWRREGEQVHPFLFLKRMQPHTDLYYTRANTYTGQTRYRYTLETYREDRCTHQLTQKTLHKRKITMRSQRSFVLSASTFCCCLCRPPLLARLTPEQRSHSEDTKVGRSTIARML